jgi:hypothetical protein
MRCDGRGIRLVLIEELPHDRDRRHAVCDHMVDPHHDPDASVARARNNEKLPWRAVERQRNGHELAAHPLEPGESVDRLGEPDVPLEVGRHLDPSVSTARRDRHATQRRKRRDPRPNDLAQCGQVGRAVVADEAARGKQARDEEHIDLADMIEDDVRLVDRREPSCRRAHARQPRRLQVRP